MEAGIRLLPDTRTSPTTATAPLVKQEHTGPRRRRRRGTITHIAQDWNEAGAYGLTGRPWTASTVSLFLRHPATPVYAHTTTRLVYDGDGQPVKGTWPA